MSVWSRRATLRFLAGSGLLASSLARSWSALAQDDSTFGPAEWMRIPRIAVDSHISDVGITEGYYDVPWFDVGHHSDSAAPGDLGNSIYNGHVVTINAGDVFRHLDEVVPGDAIYIYTPSFRLDWVTTQVFSVAAEDNGFLANTGEPRVTLYTCTGDFNPIERSYAKRFVVQGELVNVAARDASSAGG